MYRTEKNAVPNPGHTVIDDLCLEYLQIVLLYSTSVDK